MSDAVTAALKLLSRREHTRRELADKLRLRDYSQHAIDAAIERLCEIDLLSDSRFAGSYIRQNQRRFGNQRLRLELLKRGISGEEVATAIAAENLDDETQRAANVIALKYPNGIGDKQKAHRFLESRGFSFEHAQRAIATHRQTNPEEQQ